MSMVIFLKRGCEMFIIHKIKGGVKIIKEVQSIEFYPPVIVDFNYSNGTSERILLERKDGLDVKSALIRGFNTNEEFKEVSDA